MDPYGRLWSRGLFSSTSVCHMAGIAVYSSIHTTGKKHILRAVLENKISVLLIILPSWSKCPLSYSIPNSSYGTSVYFCTRRHATWSYCIQPFI